MYKYSKVFCNQTSIIKKDMVDSKAAVLHQLILLKLAFEERCEFDGNNI